MSKNRPATKEDVDLAKALVAANRFPWKLYQIVNACKSEAIGWDESGRIVLIRPEQFKRECLEPSNSVFKTKNMGSFVRQLNLYGFHKLQSTRSMRDDQETQPPVIYRFQNELFIRDRLDLLSKLHRNIGIRNRRDTCKCHQKQSAQGTQVNGCCISSQSSMILPSSVNRRSWSKCVDPSELTPSATKMTSFSKANCLPPPISSDGYRPLEKAVKPKPQEMIYESVFRSDLKSASTEREEDLETMDVTVVKKEDFDKIVSIFFERLRQDLDEPETSLAQMDCSSSSLTHDLIGRRALISRDNEVRHKKTVLPRAHADTMRPPVFHDSSFSFSASASRPIFKVADNHLDNTLNMAVVDQSSHDPWACMDFDSYKENLAYI